MTGRLVLLISTVLTSLVVLPGCGGSDDPAATEAPIESCAALEDLGYTCFKDKDIVVPDTAVKIDITPGGGVIDCKTSPGSFGCPCTTNDQCDEGYCVPTREGTNTCTQTCIDKCPGGFSCRLLSIGGADASFICVQDAISLCRPCNVNTDCNSGGLGRPEDRCVKYGPVEGNFCGSSCKEDTDCSDGYTCENSIEAETGVTTRQCVPASGECSCSGRAVAEGASTNCIRADICTGQRVCTADGLTACSATEPGEETCNGLDDNCNGVIDEGFANADGDSLADCVDPDDDNDGALDETDNCPQIENGDQKDSDGDGIGDPCDKADTPILLAVTPASPSSVNTPTVSGTAEPGAFVRIYADPFCGTEPIASTVAGPDGAFSVVVTVKDDSVNAFHARAVVSAAQPSDCTEGGLVYVEDSTPPAVPRLLGSTPPSPNKALDFVVNGDAEAGSSVQVFVGPGCVGTPIAALQTDDQGVLALPLSAADNAVNAYSAFAVDLAGNVSACSTTFEYIHDDVPPNPPILEGSAPTSPSGSVVNPTILGSAEPGAIVTLFTTPDCSGFAVGDDDVSAAGIFTAPVLVSANSTTVFWGVATDQAGNPSSCSTSSFTYTHDDAAPTTPVLLSTDPSTPGSTNAPTISGTGEPNTKVTFYVKADCTGVAVGHGDIAPDGAFAYSAILPANAAVTVYAQAVDVLGHVSGCSNGLPYTHDGKAPNPPLIVSTSPSSPGTDTHITVTTQAETGATVQIHASADCSGAVIGSAASVSGVAVIPAVVLENTTTALSADAIDAAGNLSACSATPSEFVHDGLPPTAPILTGTAPPSPSSFLTPAVLGAAEPGSQVMVFGTADCTGAPLGQAVAAPSGEFQVIASVPENTTTALSAHAVDAAGLISPCTGGLSYTHDTSQPAIVVFFGTTPTSPSNATTTPEVRGSSESGATVRLYLDAGCSGLPVAEGPTDASGGFSLAVTVAKNATTLVYGVSVDGAGNVGPCSPLPASYTHDDVPPAPPLVASIAPPSPSATTTTPTLSIAAEAGATVRVYIGTCDGAAVATGTASAGGAVTLTAAVTANAKSDLVATATDAAGNSSACSGPVPFVHDDVAPPPVFLNALTPAGPSSNPAPTLAGVAEPGTLVTVYQDASCQGAPVASGTAGGNGAFVTNVPVGTNQTSIVAATSSDSAGNVSACSNTLSYAHDDVAPAPPTITTTDPASPSTSLQPTVFGTAEPLSLVRLYGDAGCTVALGNATSTTSGGAWSVPVTSFLQANAPTPLHARATDGAGNSSACSPAFIYVHDGVGPGAPLIVSSSPQSPTNATTPPTFSGVADAGATVYLYVGSVCIGTPAATTTASPTGAFSAPAAVIENKENEIYASARDSAGNLSGCSLPFLFVQDTVAPAAPVVTGTSPGSPSKDNTPEISILAEANGMAVLYASPNCAGTPVAFGAVGANGTAIITGTVPTNTATPITATVTDRAGNTSTCSAPLIYVHDVQAPAAPTVLATAPASPSSVVLPGVSGSAEVGATVQLFYDAACATPVSAATAVAGDGTFSVTPITPVASNASTGIRARATDAAGNTSACSGPLAYIHDSMGPIAPTISGSTPPSPTNATLTPTVNGVAEPLSTVELYVGAPCSGPPSLVVAAGAAGAFSGTVTVNANATTLIFAAAIDASGNRSNCALPFLFVHDATGPSGIALIGSDPASPSPNPSPKLLGSSEAGAKVTVFASSDCSGASAGTGVVGTDGAFGVTVAVALNSVTTFSARAVDGAGNASACSNAINYQHDNTPPITPVLGAASPASPSTTVTSFTIPGTGDANVRTLIYPLPACGGAPTDSLDSNPDGTFTLSITIAPNSSVTYSVSAVDAVGNLSGCSNDVVLVNDNTPPTTPVLTATNPASPGMSLTPTFLGTGEATTTVWLFIDASCAAGLGVSAVVAADGTFTVPFTDPVPPNSTFTVYAQAIDSAGNVSLCSAPLSYKHDSAPPAPPAITAATPASPNNVSTTPAISGTTEGKATVRVFVGAACTGSPAATTTATAGGTFSAPITVVANTTTLVYAQAVDVAGNVSNCSAPFSYTHDTKAPTTIQITAVAPTSPSTEPSPTVSVLSEAGATIQVFAAAGCAGSAVANGTANGSGAAQIQSPAINNAVTTFTARATDAAGNVSPCSNAVTYTHDSLSPGAPAITSFTPTSPGSSLKPTANGTAEAGSKVTLYLNDTCTSVGSATATVPASGLFAIALTQNVGANTSTPIFAQAVDAAGNPSACSAGVPYVHDNVAPSAPVLTSVAPTSPSTELRPTISGSAEAGSSVQFYTNATCTLALGTPTVTPVGGAFANKLSAAVTANATTNLYAKATDAAGNASVCSTTFVTYTHDGSAPSSPILTSTTPTSPNNSDTTPTINGKVEAGVVTVELYSGTACQTLITTLTPLANLTFSVDATVVANTSNNYTAKAIDAAGNKSVCSTPALNYIHDSIPPAFAVAFAGPTLTLGVGGAATVTWTAATDNFTPTASIKYEICVTDKCGFTCTPWTPSVNTASGALSASITGLAPNKRYFVLVRARDLAGNLDANVKLSSLQTPGTNIASGMTVGGSKSCAYLADGTERCWGGGVAVDSVVVLAHGPSHWCGVYPSGNVGCAGENASGQLGNGSTAASSVSVLVQLATGGNLSNIKSVSVGDAHSCAVTVDGKVYCWGFNLHGAVGSQGGAQVLKAVPVLNGDGTPLTGVVELTSGSEHNCARLYDGTAKCWGFNWAGQLGTGSTGVSNTPVAVDLTDAHAFVDLALGTDHSCGLSVSGDVYCWGSNAQSQLGLGSGAPGYAYRPTATGVSGARAVGAGGSHSCAVLGGGAVRCWGNNDNGQVGIDSAAAKVDSPTQVTNLANALLVDGGTSHTCALLGTGEIYCWGLNAGGQLGDGTLIKRLKPVAVTQLQGLSYPTQLSRGGGHACARLSDGTMRCWGQNDSGQCGTTASPATPEAMSVILSLPATFAEATGGAHSCAIQANGAVACWGKNDAGQLGGGTTGGSFSTPGGVSLPKAARSVVLGASHSCALLVDGTLYCWGDNTNGQLGTGGASSNVPAKVPLADVLMVTAGRAHTCAYTGGATAKVYCWGDNSRTQLGVSGAARTAPTAVTVQPASVSALSTFGDHTCVILASGAATCWGGNTNGQLGDGTKVDKVNPTAVSSLTTIRQLSTGGSHTCSLLTDDTARCWGSNSQGELGIGSVVEQAVPTLVPSFTAVRQIASGDKATCALRYDGKAYCWGTNPQNSLGIGAAASYATPQLVQCLP